MSNFFLYVLMPWQWSWWCSPTKRNIVKVCNLSDYVKFVQCSLFQILQEITLGWQFHVPFCLVRSLSEILQKNVQFFYMLMSWQWSWWCSSTKRNIVKVCNLSDYVKFVQCSLFQIWQEITLGWQFHVPFCLVRSLSEIL